jgi:hypothetical protein
MIYYKKYKMDKENIKEAKRNFDNYLNEGLIKKEKFNKIIFDTYIKNYKESIKLVNKIYKEDLSDLWLIVVSYYSMFYIANAYIYKLGYKTGHKIVHKITSDLLIVLVKDKVSKKIIDDYDIEKEKALEISENLIESFEFERKKRGVFQYEIIPKLKKSKSQTSYDRAKKFSFEFEKLLEFS